MIMYSIKWRTEDPINEKPPSWDSLPVHICGWISAPSVESLKKDMQKHEQKYGKLIFENMEVQTL